MNRVQRIFGCNCRTCQPDYPPLGRLIFNAWGGLGVALIIIQILRSYGW
ncbi:hypothetical protein [Sphingomonas elodea]|nr:hypothetical protein [Sphingomonas elodea]